jgi:energy-coupling factor transporter ATP-binding protein EcfA2
MRVHEALCPSNGLLVHAAAVCTSKGALLLLGHSGAGKSTLCRLLSEQYQVLTDDLVVLTRQQDETWMVADLGQTVNRSSQKQVPLYATVRIFQSKTTRLRSASPRQACQHLTDAIFELVGEDKEELSRIRTWFAFAAEISRRHTGWQLCFRRDPEVVKFISAEFGSGFTANQERTTD